MDDNHQPQHAAEETRSLDLKLSNKVYDTLKFWAQVGLPAAGTLYFTLSTIWGLPAAEQVVGSIVAFDAFLGVVLGFSSASYKDKTEGKMIGFVDVQTNGEEKRFVLNFPGDPMDIVKHDKVTFKVRNV